MEITKSWYLVIVIWIVECFTRNNQILLFLRINFGARGAADRGVESLRFQVSIEIAVSNPTQAGQRFTWSKTWCDRQQLWKAVITGDTVTRLSIPIRGRGKSPEEGQR